MLLTKLMNMVLRAEVWVGLIAVVLLIRNIFYTQYTFTEVYANTIHKKISLFQRCSCAYFNSNGTKSFHRMYFFNILRCCLPKTLECIVYDGKVDI